MLNLFKTFNILTRIYHVESRKPRENQVRGEKVIIYFVLKYHKTKQKPILISRQYLRFINNLNVVFQWWLLYAPVWSMLPALLFSKDTIMFLRSTHILYTFTQECSKRKHLLFSVRLASPSHWMGRDIKKPIF